MPLFMLLVLLTIFMIYHIEKSEPEQVAKAKEAIGITKMPLFFMYVFALFPITQTLVLLF